MASLTEKDNPIQESAILNLWHLTFYINLKKLIWCSRYIEMFSQDFVTLLKLKADVIKEMFQQDTVHTWPVPAPCHCLLLEKGLRKNLMFFS